MHFILDLCMSTLLMVHSQMPLSPIPEKIDTAHYLQGKFEASEHPDWFAEVPAAYADRSGHYLRKEALTAFVEMAKAAEKDGVRLKIISATRSFYRQKSIWEAKWTGKRKVEGKFLPKSHPETKARALFILRYSSMPGTSRHHWGTDFDINNLNDSYFLKEPGKSEYAWLQKHAAGYGFCQPYSRKGSRRPSGYEEEKWHWSYMPLAAPLTKMYADLLSDHDIQGFAGAESAPSIGMVAAYVEGLNPMCYE